MGIKIIYLTGEGLWRQCKGIIETEFPGSIRNKREPQQHSLVPNPVFPEVMTLYPDKSKSGLCYHRPFKTWEEFINFPTPQVVRENEKSFMVGFDNDSYPLGPNPPTVEEEEVKANARQAAFQEACLRGNRIAERMDRGTETFIVVALAGVAGILTIVLAILGLVGVFG